WEGLAAGPPLLHHPLDLDVPTIPALRAKEIGPGQPDADAHRAPAAVLKAALEAPLPVVDDLAVLAHEHRPLEDDGPPLPGRLRGGGSPTRSWGASVRGVCFGCRGREQVLHPRG